MYFKKYLIKNYLNYKVNHISPSEDWAEINDSNYSISHRNGNNTCSRGQYCGLRHYSRPACQSWRRKTFGSATKGEGRITASGETTHAALFLTTPTNILFSIESSNMIFQTHSQSSSIFLFLLEHLGCLPSLVCENVSSRSVSITRFLWIFMPFVKQPRLRKVPWEHEQPSFMGLFPQQLCNTHLQHRGHLTNS